MSFVPGMTGGAAAVPQVAGASPPTSIALFDSSTSTAATITAPASILAGDIIVLADRGREAFGNPPPATVVPTGFTPINNQAGAARDRQILSYSSLGTEGGSSITGMNGASFNLKVMVVFRPNNPAASLTLGGAVGTISDGNPSAQNVTASGGTSPLVIVAAYASNDPVSPRTMSPAKDGEVDATNADGVNMWLAWKIYNSSPADVSLDMDDEGGNNCVQGGYLAAA